MKKIIIITLLFIILACNIYNNSLAFERLGEVNLISLGACDTYLTDGKRNQHTDYVAYLREGVYYPAYCVNPTLNGVGTEGVGNYAVNVNSKIIDINIWRAIINGYPYKSIEELGVANEREAFTATKFAVFTIIYKEASDYFKSVGTEAGDRTASACKKIVEDARASTEILENNIQMNIVPDSESWQVDNINKTYVSKVYTMNSQISNGNYIISLEGNLPEGMKVVDENNNEKNNFTINEKFKIIVPIKNLLENGIFTIKAVSNFATKPVLYGATTVPGLQNYALTGYMTEDSGCTYIENYSQNITKIHIIKQDGENENRLAGVKFNLLDANKNKIGEKLITNNDGEIFLENMIPDKYYIQEVETLPEYNLYTDFIEINLSLNEEVKIVVNNLPKKITKFDKNIENVEVSSKLEETKYNENIENVEISSKLEETKYNKNIVNTVKTNTTKKLPVTGY